MEAGNIKIAHFWFRNLAYNRYPGKWNNAIGMEYKGITKGGTGCVIILATTADQVRIRVSANRTLDFQPLVRER
jgi:hypothetical protein